MEFASIGSGSAGNATLVHCKDDLLLIDCGFSCKAIELGVARLGRTPEDISAILVTHEHSDHVRGLGTLARRYRLPIFATPGTMHGFPRRQSLDIHWIQPLTPVRIGRFEILPIPVPHDAREPVQFVLTCGKLQFGMLTDLGFVPDYVADCLLHCHALFLECNHDLDLLLNGPYSRSLKRRIGGDYGHLNNAQAADLLVRLLAGPLQSLVVGHISQQNNGIREISATLAPVLRETRIQPVYATQANGFSWRPVDPALSRFLEVPVPGLENGSG